MRDTCSMACSNSTSSMTGGRGGGGGREAGKVRLGLLCTILGACASHSQHPRPKNPALLPSPALPYA